MNHRVSATKDYTFVANTGQDSSGNHYAVLDHPLVFLSLQRLGETMPCYDNVILVLAKGLSRQADEVIFDFSCSYQFNAHLCKPYGINKASIACGNTDLLYRNFEEVCPNVQSDPAKQNSNARTEFLPEITMASFFYAE